MTCKFKVGDDYPVWWNTGRKDWQGVYQAKIVDILPYTGKYSDEFDHVLILMPGSGVSNTEMAV